MKGIINLYKPKGITSSSAVVSCRKILGIKAIGHMGTLDPAGEGVLLLGVGKATRLFDFFLKKDKVYEAEFEFGYATDTLDGDGAVTDSTNNLPSKDEIEAVLSKFTGKQQQIPPAYSAKSVNGVRAYKMARTGRSPELKPCEVEIYSVKLIKQTGDNKYLFEIHCSSGTYIRSICRDIAAELNSLATMVSIKRTRCGNFCVQNSVTLEKLNELKAAALVPIEEAIATLPKTELDDEFYAPLLNGIKVKYDGEEGKPTALYCKNELFGIATIENGFIRIKTYLRD